MMTRLFTVLMVCVLLSGCASLVSKSAWPVFIDNSTGPAQFVITNHNNVEMGRGQTPSIIILESGAGYFWKANYIVHFSKPGYRNQGYRLVSYFNRWYLGNLLNIVGLFIDPATGAMWRLPEQLIISLPKLEPPPGSFNERNETGQSVPSMR
jgi:hypothetical protein